MCMFSGSVATPGSISVTAGQAPLRFQSLNQPYSIGWLPVQAHS